MSHFDVKEHAQACLELFRTQAKDSPYHELITLACEHYSERVCEAFVQGLAMFRVSVSTKVKEGVSDPVEEASLYAYQYIRDYIEDLRMHGWRLYLTSFEQCVMAKVFLYHPHFKDIFLGACRSAVKGHMQVVNEGRAAAGLAPLMEFQGFFTKTEYLQNHPH